MFMYFQLLFLLKSRSLAVKNKFRVVVGKDVVDIVRTNCDFQIGRTHSFNAIRISREQRAKFELR